jgi:pilus assembly protein Flp/PilA
MLKAKLWNFYVKAQSLILAEDGQDLIEYALVVALIAFAATAGMNSLASGINTAFNNLSGMLNTYVS